MTLTICLDLQEEYKSIPLLRKKKQQKIVQEVPHLKIILTVEEEYTEQESLWTPQEEEQSPFGDLTVEELREKEQRALTSRERRRLSERVALASMLSSSQSISERKCKKCAHDVGPKGDSFRILVKLKRQEDYLLCRFCNEVEIAESLYNQYTTWVAEQLNPTDKGTKPLKRTQKHRIPTQEVWQEAYERDMSLPIKERSFLRRLEESLDRWRMQ